MSKKTSTVAGYGKVTLKVVNVITISQVAPEIVELSEYWKQYLINKYGYEKFKHIDRFFNRVKINDKTYIYIPGVKVFGAFKKQVGEYLKQIGKSEEEIENFYKKYQWKYGTIIGIYFPEEAVGIKYRYLRPPVPPKEKQKETTLSSFEVIDSGTQGFMKYIGVLPPEFKKVKIIQVGPWASRGFGLIQVLWETEHEDTTIVIEEFK